MPDAAVAVVPVAPAVDAAVPAVPVDAAPRVALADARGYRAGADAAPVPVDADVAVAVVAPADAAAPPDAPARPSAILVKNDTWCDVWIDGALRGRISRTPYEVAPGHHTVRCFQQSTSLEWTKDVDVAAGETAIAENQMRASFKVTIGVSSGASIDGAFYPSGATPILKTGHYLVEADKLKQYVDLFRACTLREHSDGTQPPFDCAP